ncbi:MAG: methyltransferase domain-containing protein [Synergistaceae bacterium]|jgi:radical SAM protein with 4Fe4S-binding SPASM domain|nr:methyltransferase domain-containing protein [Synergistaceae bacterium]
MKKHPVYGEKFFQGEQETSAKSAVLVLNIVNNFVTVNSVVDIGCGVGEWLKVYYEKGIDNILGIDGAYLNPAQLVIPREHFMPKDISQPITDIQQKFDLAISLEVAEHIDPSCVEIYIDNITNFSDVILFSAAIPTQGGDHHVNEQWPSYWIERFRRVGYVPIDCIRWSIWNLKDVSFIYKQNIMFYIKETVIDSHPLLKEQIQQGRSHIFDVVHPECYLYLGSVQTICFRLRRLFLALGSALLRAMKRIKDKLWGTLKLKLKKPYHLLKCKALGSLYLISLHLLSNKQRFRFFINTVYLESSASCNRRCVYCPQSVMQRPKLNMSNNVLNIVLDQLCSIRFKRRVCLNWINEPLEDSAHLLSMIVTIKERLPESKLYLSTNGDFLTSDLLERLEAKGLSYLIISLHLNEPQKWDVTETKRYFDVFLKRLGLEEKRIILTTKRYFFQAMLKYKKLSIKFFSLDYLQIGTTRASSVNTVSIGKYIREQSCTRPLTDFYVSYDGSVYPCCDFYHGFMAHENYRIGNVLEESIFYLHTNEFMSKFTKNSLKAGQKEWPCTSCRT